MRTNTPHMIAALQASADIQISRRSARYKRLYDAELHSGSRSVLKQWVFIDKLPLAGSPNTANDITKASCNKLQPRKGRQFQIIHSYPHTFKVYEDRVWYKMPIEQASVAPALIEYPETTQTPTSPEAESYPTQRFLKKKQSVPIRNDTNS